MQIQNNKRIMNPYADQLNTKLAIILGVILDFRDLVWYKALNCCSTS